MRAILVLAILGIAPASAAACPRGGACLESASTADRLARLVVERRIGLSTVRMHDRARERAVRERPASARAVDLRLPALAGRPRTPLAGALRTHAPPPPSELEMPWIWRVLRQEVYARMPHVEEPDFSLTLMPVVVAGTFDTVPGIGIGGEF